MNSSTPCLQLTAARQIDPAEYTDAAGLLPVLERMADRIFANGLPTAVEMSHAMVNGRPFPFASNAMSQSAPPP